MNNKKKVIYIVGLFLLIKEAQLYAENKKHIITYEDTLIETGMSIQAICTLDLSDAILKLDIEKELTTEEQEVCNKLYPTHLAAINAAKKLNLPILPSVGLILSKSKLANDLFYASLEIYLQKGIGIIKEGKRNFLYSLYKELLDYREKRYKHNKDKKDKVSNFEKEAINYALAYIIAGLKASGDKEIGISEEIKKYFSDFYNSFMESEGRAKVIGFYTASPLLEEIFRQDRFYQIILKFKSSTETAAALLITYIINNKPLLWKQYKTIIDFYAKITNPLNAFSAYDYNKALKNIHSLEDVISSPWRIEIWKSQFRKVPIYHKFLNKRGTETHECFGWALFPFSYSKETDLRVTSPQEYIEFIKNRVIDLTPTADSGWYDWQQYAIESLILPEKGEEVKKLNLTEEYKKYLEDCFAGILIAMRETHVKQLEIAEEIVIELAPRLRLEPLATVYLRTAEGYKFILQNLEKLLGEAAFSQTFILDEKMKSFATKTLKKELKSLMYLMYGLYFLACEDIGLTPKIKLKEKKEAIELAQTWLKNIENDDLLKEDIRVSLPIIAPRGDDWINWAILGVKLLKLRVEYEKFPKIISIKDKDGVPIEIDEINFVPRYYLIPILVWGQFVNFESPFVLTRKEFREILNKCDSEEQVRELLKRGNLNPHKFPFKGKGVFKKVKKILKKISAPKKIDVPIFFIIQILAVVLLLIVLFIINYKKIIKRKNLKNERFKT